MVEAFAKVSEASKLLMEKGLTPATVNAALGLVGGAMQVSRASLYENRSFGTRGRFLTDQRFGWSAQGVLTLPDLRNLALRELAPNWVDTLASGNPVSCLVSEAPTPMRQLLEPRLVKSILLCPVTPVKEWWGFVAFEDCAQARRWLPEEVTLLRALARSMGSCIRSRQMRETLDQARNQLREVVRSCSGTGR